MTFVSVVYTHTTLFALCLLFVASAVTQGIVVIPNGNTGNKYRRR
jgi:hypothetical protein